MFKQGTFKFSFQVLVYVSNCTFYLGIKEIGKFFFYNCM